MSSCTSYTHLSVVAVLKFCRLSRLAYLTFLCLVGALHGCLTVFPKQLIKKKVGQLLSLFLPFRLLGGIDYLNRAYTDQ
jgi:hypothetical protein